jgi:hypothetical protein
MGPTFSPARPGRIVALLALCLLLSGCAKSKVTQANFDKIDNDMTLDDVVAILGEGQAQGDGSMVAGQFGVDVNAGGRPSSTETYLWEKGNAKITITFRGNKVVGKTSSGL